MLKKGSGTKIDLGNILLKMKLTSSTIIATIATMVNAQNSTETSIGRMGGAVTGGMGVRRYSDLLKLVKHFTPEFDERKYWAYGCNCLILGDRPMSDPGFGRPVDPLDMICKQYKVSTVLCSTENYTYLGLSKMREA